MRIGVLLTVRGEPLFVLTVSAWPPTFLLPFSRKGTTVPESYISLPSEAPLPTLPMMKTIDRTRPYVHDIIHYHYQRAAVQREKRASKEGAVPLAIFSRGAFDNDPGACGPDLSRPRLPRRAWHDIVGRASLKGGQGFLLHCMFSFYHYTIGQIPIGRDNKQSRPDRRDGERGPDQEDASGEEPVRPCRCHQSGACEGRKSSFPGHRELLLCAAKGADRTEPQDRHGDQHTVEDSGEVLACGRGEGTAQPRKEVGREGRTLEDTERWRGSVSRCLYDEGSIEPLYGA